MLLLSLKGRLKMRTLLRLKAVLSLSKVGALLRLSLCVELRLKVWILELGLRSQIQLRVLRASGAHQLHLLYPLLLLKVLKVLKVLLWLLWLLLLRSACEEGRAVHCLPPREHCNTARCLSVCSAGDVCLSVYLSICDGWKERV